MGFQSAQHAKQLLDRIADMTAKGWETASVVDRAQEELRTLVEHHFSDDERLDYTKRLASGEPVLSILKRFASRQ